MENITPGCRSLLGSASSLVVIRRFADTLHLPSSVWLDRVVRISLPRRASKNLKQYVVWGKSAAAIGTHDGWSSDHPRTPSREGVRHALLQEQRPQALIKACPSSSSFSLAYSVLNMARSYLLKLYLSDPEKSGLWPLGQQRVEMLPDQAPPAGIWRGCRQASALLRQGAHGPESSGGSLDRGLQNSIRLSQQP